MNMNINPAWLTVCNNALSRLNVEILESLDEPTLSATLCQELLPVCIGEVFNVRPWRSARKRVKLTASLEEPPFGYRHMFLLPNDFVRIVSLNLQNGEWEREGRYILANETVLELVYIAIPESINNISPLLISAITARLASKLAPTLKGNENIGQMLYQESIIALRTAVTEEEAGMTDEMYETNDWEEAFHG